MTKFFRGGGTIADTISDVPERIDKMLGNYKKVAIIEMDTTISKTGVYWRKKININTNFKQNFIFVTLEYKKKFSIASSKLHKIENPLYTNNLFVHFENITDNSFDICFQSSYEGDPKITQVIAIE